MRSFDAYRKRWIEREKRDGAVQEARRLAAICTSNRLALILADEFSVRKVVLFGSCVESGRFMEHSDIDLAVESLPKDRFFEALARIMQESPFPVDLKPVEEVNDALKSRIRKGVILYEA